MLITSHTHLVALLEEKRNALGETQAQFAKRLLDSARAPVDYCNAKAGTFCLSAKYAKGIADVLEVPLVDIEGLLDSLPRVGKSGDPGLKFSATELRQFADIAEKLGKPLSISMLMQIVQE
jgi:hypothetical protein